MFEKHSPEILANTEYLGFYIVFWLLISFYTPKIGLNENSDDKIGNLEEGDLSIEITNHSQRFITLIQNNIFSIFYVSCHNCEKTPKYINFD